MIRAFIVGSSSPVRASLQRLAAGRDLEIVGSAPGLESLAGQWPDLEADLVIVEVPDGQLPEIVDSLVGSGLASEAPIVILSDRPGPGPVADALRAGVRAVLPEDLAPDQLHAALEAAAAGLTVIHSGEVAAIFPRAASAARPSVDLAEPLTPRENEVLQMLAGGLVNKEIAARLAISDHTVKFHVASILGKFGAATRTEAVAIGIRRGLVLL